MLNVLKSEFFKLRKSKGTFICLGVILGGVLLTLLMFLGLKNQFSSDEMSLTGLAFDASGGTLAMFNSGFQIFIIVMCVVVCALYAGEYRRGTLRNSMTAGVSRTGVYLAKYLTAMLATAAVYIAVTLIFFSVLGITGGLGTVPAGKFIGYFLLQLLMFLATTSLVFFFSVLTKNTGATIGITLGIIFLVQLLASIEVFSSIGSMTSGGELAPPEPSEKSLFFKVIDEITLLFTPTQISNAAGMQLTFWRMIESIAVGIVTLGASFAGGLALFNKQDQK